MNEAAKTWWLTNGVVVEVADESLRSTADTWTVKLVVKGTIEVKAAYLSDFEDDPDYLEILSMILPSAQYKREVSKAGVREEHLPAQRTALLDAFEKNALLYFEKPDFPERYVRKLYKELEKELAQNAITRERLKK